MLTVTIIGGLILWLSLGSLVVAIITALGLAESLGIHHTDNAACALIMWPIALAATVVLVFCKIAQCLGHNPGYLIPAFLAVFGTLFLTLYRWL